ncbi:FTR1 family iron permease [Aromatoleum diolicum]|uniref:FTR1 family iron permease n=1 Tax=Aromatoleum diolicum TaxID=75796 RepID=A0ABX1Q8E9_9RHOO|nr:FTR1 family protein [Aromatoleum diolicum]NMG73820.1 FTR1 family iron permease [Aromatoleum diolicum]
MGNALFMVWRESVEAILVISILHAWIRARGDAQIGVRHLWAGVGGGLVLAGLLALAMLGVHGWLAADALDLFQTAIMLVAAGLITHMVLWMRSHGRHMKGELEAGLARAAETAGGASVAVLAAIAVGREGAETVLFLYGLAMEQSGATLAQMFAGAGIGFVLALATAWLIQGGARWLPSRVFFRATEIMLLLLAAALLVSGVERLIDLEWLPPLVEPVWDSSLLLDDASTTGGIAAAFAGYRAQPSLMVLVAWFGYWALVMCLGRTQRRT